MQIDRRVFLGTLGTAAAINVMPSETLADALEHHIMETLDEQTTTNELKVRRGAGVLFGTPGPLEKQAPPLKKLEPMPQTQRSSISSNTGSPLPRTCCKAPPMQCERARKKK